MITKNQVYWNDNQCRVEITFSSKPPDSTRKALKENGFSWDSVLYVWYLNHPPLMNADYSMIQNPNKAALENINKILPCDVAGLLKSIDNDGHRRGAMQMVADQAI